MGNNMTNDEVNFDVVAMQKQLHEKSKQNYIPEPNKPVLLRGYGGQIEPRIVCKWCGRLIKSLPKGRVQEQVYPRSLHSLNYNILTCKECEPSDKKCIGCHELLTKNNTCDYRRRQHIKLCINCSPNDGRNGGRYKCSEKFEIEKINNTIYKDKFCKICGVQLTSPKHDGKNFGNWYPTHIEHQQLICKKCSDEKHKKYPQDSENHKEIQYKISKDDMYSEGYNGFKNL